MTTKSREGAPATAWRKKYGPACYRESVAGMSTVSVPIADLIVMLDELDWMVAWRIERAQAPALLEALRDLLAFESFAINGSTMRELPAVEGAIRRAEAAIRAATGGQE